MAAVALALDEDRPDLATTPLRTRSRRRRQKTRIRHDCHRWHGPEGRKLYATVLVRCLVHNVAMTPLGDYGRPYPEPICYQCLPPHERVCPMGNAEVITSWLIGLNCVCDSRLKILGLKVQKVPGPPRGRVWAVGPG